MECSTQQKKKLIGIVSLGCPKNRVDTEVMLGHLVRAGHMITGNPEEADIIIINTCGFINDAKQESIDTILEMTEYKKTNNMILVTGCLTQRYLEELSKELPEVDGLIGVDSYDDIIDIINAMENGDRVVGWTHAKQKAPFENRALTTPFYTAYVKIAEGCDNCCSYCAIPSIRGKYVSRPIREVIDECKVLASKGILEIVLIAQDTTRYGEDIGRPELLVDLLNALNEIDELKWIRVMYCYPERISKNILDAIAGLSKVCNYLDIPIQHIDADILQSMNRQSTPDDIIGLMERIKLKDDSFSLRTSLIAGYPGETQQQFDRLCDFIQDYPFNHLGAFAYSPEDGTVAAELPDQIHEDIRNQRRDKLMEIQYNVVEKLNNQNIGRVYEAVVEGFDEHSEMYFGRTYAQAPDIDEKVFFDSENSLEPGQFVIIEIVGYEQYDWIGEIIDEPTE